MREKIAPFAMAILLITAGLGGPSTGTASALWSGDDCSAIDNFIHDLLTFQNVNEDADNPCSTQYKVNQAIEDMKESDANQTKVDIYQAAAAEAGNKETFGTVYDNYLNDTESVAWMKMQVAVAEAYQNGSSQAVARAKARQAIEDYYAVKQINLIESWNSSVSTYWYLRGVAASEDGITIDNEGNSFVTITDGVYDRTGGDYSVTNITETKTLVNGSSHGVYAFDIWAGTTTSDGYASVQSINDGAINWDSSTHQYYYYSTGMKVKAPNENYNELYILKFNDYQNRWNKVITKQNNLQSEAENFVNATYADFESGEINSSDVISANTAMFEYGVRNAGEDEGFYNSVGALSMMGYDTPNLNNSGVMNVSYSGNTYQGVLMAHEAPGGQWETGVTYNESNFSGPVFIATVDGNKVDIGTNETFTISDMTNREGEDVQTVETTKYVYKTANTSELLQLQQDLTTLRAEIEAREPDGGGTTGGGIGFNYSDKMLLVVAAGAAVYVLGSRA